MKRQEDLIEVLESLYNAFEDFRDNKFPQLVPIISKVLLIVCLPFVLLYVVLKKLVEESKKKRIRKALGLLIDWIKYGNYREVGKAEALLILFSGKGEDYEQFIEKMY